MGSPPDRVHWLAAGTNGTFADSVSVLLCAVTSENVTSTALASLNGLSVNITFNVPLRDGPVGEPPQARAVTIQARVALSLARISST